MSNNNYQRNELVLNMIGGNNTIYNQTLNIIFSVVHL
jgi:hypothetical protein